MPLALSLAQVLTNPAQVVGALTPIFFRVAGTYHITLLRCTLTGTL